MIILNKLTQLSKDILAAGLKDDIEIIYNKVSGIKILHKPSVNLDRLNELKRLHAKKPFVSEEKYNKKFSNKKKIDAGFLSNTKR